MNSMEDDLTLAIFAAQRAGAVVMRGFGRPQEVVEKAPGQPVTPTDLEADQLLAEMLLSERPGYGWLSEETIDRPDRLDAERVWIVDPLDGTRSFIEGRPEFAVSVGLARDGRPVLGVVYNPAAGELYWGIVGGGSYRAEVPVQSLRGGRAFDPFLHPDAAVRLSVSDQESGQELVIFASRHELSAGEFGPWVDGEGVAGRWRIEPVGSTAYKLARIAAGTGEIFLSRGPKSEWDICAGALLVEEAGGVVTDLYGDELLYNMPDTRIHGILATNGLVHGDFLEYVAELPPIPRIHRERW